MASLYWLSDAESERIEPFLPRGAGAGRIVSMGGTLVRSIGLVRAKARIGLKNLA